MGQHVGIFAKHTGGIDIIARFRVRQLRVAVPVNARQADMTRLCGMQWRRDVTSCVSFLCSFYVLKDDGCTVALRPRYYYCMHKCFMRFTCFDVLFTWFYVPFLSLVLCIVPV